MVWGFFVSHTLHWLKNVLPVGLAAATLAAVFPFFAGGGKVLYTSEARPLERTRACRVARQEAMQLVKLIEREERTVIKDRDGIFG